MMGEFINLNQRLSNLNMETPPQALVILRRKQLFAHAGILPYSAVEELVGLINSMSRFFSNNLQKQLPSGLPRSGYGDLVRFVQLQATQGKYLLYAVYLARDMMLALLFNPEIPFNKVRKQTLQIARELQTPSSTNALEFRTAQALAGSHLESQTESSKPPTSTWISETQPSQVASRPPTMVLNPVYTKTTDPQVEPMGDTESTTRFSTDQPLETDLGQTSPSLEVEAETGDIAYHDSAELVEPSSDGENRSLQENLKPDQNTNDLAHETTSMPSVFDHYITYSCLLIPRMPQHMLNSNLASHLFKWMGQLCLAYGWRLEHLSIHSNHVQWIAGAPLTTSPAYLVRILRQKTSSYIFTQFPPLSNENPSGDFWAPGFFISGGRQSIQAHLVEKYIDEIRDHQGVNNPDIYN